MEIIEISKAELKRELFEDVLFVQFNEAGAMDSHAGTVCVVKPDGKFCQISFCKGDISLRDIEDAFPAMREWNFGVCGNDSTVSAGWIYFYIGLGCHLVVHESVYEEFCKWRDDFKVKKPVRWWRSFAEQTVNKPE